MLSKLLWAVFLSATSLIAGVHYNQALALQKSAPDDIDEIVRELKLEVADYPESPKARLILATTQITASRYDGALEALADLEKLCDSKKITEPIVYWLRLQCYYFKDDYLICLELIERYKPIFASRPDYKSRFDGFVIGVKTPYIVRLEMEARGLKQSPSEPLSADHLAPVTGSDKK